MISRRILVLSVLSLCCATTFLYYILVPQDVPWFAWSDLAVSQHTNGKPDGLYQWAKTSMKNASKFTPEILLSAPRRTAAVPNDAGTLALYSVSTYSFDSHKRTKEIRVLNVSTGQSRLVTSEEKVSSPCWIGPTNEILWLRSGEKGTTNLVIGNVDEVGRTYIAARIPGPISDFKLKSVSEEHVAIAFVGEAKPDGSLYNKENEPQKKSSAMLYEHLRVRHWDRYVMPNRNAIFHAILSKQKPHVTESKGRYNLGNITNVLRGSHLESPVPPFGGSDHYDLGVRGVIFVAKDPELNPSMHTKSNFYFVEINDGNYASPVKVKVKSLEGASTSPVFHPDGLSAVFFQMKIDGYESDRNRIILVSDVTKPESAFEMLDGQDGKGLWDRSPSSATWASDGKAIILTADNEGSVDIYKFDIPEDARDLTTRPKKLAISGSVSSLHPFGADSSEYFMSGSNFVDNSMYSIVNVADLAETRVISSNSHNGSYFGLSQDQVSETWFEGAGDQRVHAWVVKPSYFDPTTKYPLAYMIHGGPQGSWEDAWSTRWNPAVFAEQGYVVILPDPTGSTGYGQSFTDAIRNEWGGLPYEDLVNGLEHIRENLTYVDTSRAVALGASYGGYMMAWMQGHALGRKFKALVCHDGSFNIAAQLASDDQYFPNHDLGGRFDLDKQNMSKWEQWSPVNHVDEWETPMLVIHSQLDYRLPISEGLAMFNVLQERGIKSRFLTFPDENHWVLNEENSLVWHTIVLNWINGFVGLPEYKDENTLDFEVRF